MSEHTFQPLVITPLPLAGESLTGLVLRTSEMNGYRVPEDMLRYAGMNQGEARSVRLPLEKLAKLYGRKASDFSLLSYGSGNKNTQNKTGEVDCKSIPRFHLNIKHSKICPECVIEKGVIEAYWDLRYAVVCPIHRRLAVTACPVCKLNLRWVRRGLLTCSCGHDLSGERGDIIDDSKVLALAALLRDKSVNSPASNVALAQYGFPLAELSGVSLSTLTRIILRVASGRNMKANLIYPHSALVKIHQLKVAAGFLSQWPQGFYDYLEDSVPVDERILGATLQEQFHKFYSAFFKSGLPIEETQFVRQAFIGFGNERWKTKGYIDPRIAKDAGIPSNIVGIYGLAKALKIMPSTARRYVENGIIKGTYVKTPHGKRLMFDLDKIPFKPSEGTYYRIRDAGKFLGLPVTLLSYLRERKIYTVKHLGFSSGEGYSEIDLIEFRESLIKQAPRVVEFNHDDHISLKKILYMKNVGLHIKAFIIESILNGKSHPIGRTGEAIGDLVLNKQGVLSFLEAVRKRRLTRLKKRQPIRSHETV